MDLALIALHTRQAAPAVHVQPWQAVNLVGGPLAALLLLPAVIDDLERWWKGRARERSEADRAGRRGGG